MLRSKSFESFQKSASLLNTPLNIANYINFTVVDNSNAYQKVCTFCGPHNRPSNVPEKAVDEIFYNFKHLFETKGKDIDSESVCVKENDLVFVGSFDLFDYEKDKDINRVNKIYVFNKLFSEFCIEHGVSPHTEPVKKLFEKACNDVMMNPNPDFSDQNLDINLTRKAYTLFEKYLELRKNGYMD